jgi:Carboxypeptidase regulatory-like domain
MKEPSCKRVFSALALLCALAFAMFAQSERGSISGEVRDSTGAVMPGVRVTLTDLDTNTTSTATTNDAGGFTFPNLPVGRFVLRAQKEGFRPAVVSNITVNASASVRADVTLEIGATQQAVEVQAAAAQLQTEDAKTSSTVTNKMVDQLPLVVGGTLRSPFDLASLTPESKNVGGDNGFVLGGGQAASYGTTLDGVSTNTARALSMSWVSSNAPSLEAVTEFTVDSNGFKAEYGHAGGGVMTFVSKSGTNDYHGSAYEFLRNNDFDANRFFSNRAGLPRAIYKQNDFGASAGGPIWIPKLYNGHNKSFFFFAYEGFRNRAGATAFTTTVPTPEMYNGDFSKWVDASGKQIPIYDPTTQTTGANGVVTRTPFPNNQIPKNLFDPLAVKALSVFQAGAGPLMPNTGAAPGTVGYVNNNYNVASGSQVSPINKLSIKGDHIFSERDRISGYYGYDRESLVPGPDGPSTLPGLYTNYNDLRQDSDVVRFSWDHTFSPTKFNHFYAGGNNWRQNHNPPQEYIGNWKDKLCLPNVPDCNQNLLNLTFSNGYGGWGGNANNGSENTVYAFNDDFTWIRGAHTFKFGGMFQLTHYNGFGRQCVSGCVGFSFTETGLPGNTNLSSGGNPFASFLLGYADSGQLDTVRFIGQQWPYYAGYFQDDWRISPKLTINLGLRWETQLPPTGLEDRWADFSPTTPNPAANNIPGAVIFAGSGQGRQGSRTLADSYFKAFGPRFGFAYSLNSKTVIRGGYGRSFGQIQTTTGSAHNMGNTLTQTFSNGSNGIQPTFLLNQGLPAWTAPPFINPSVSNGSSVSWWQGSEATRPPEDNNFNLSIQRQLTSSIVLEGSYNAVIGSHLVSGLLNYNQVNPAYLNQYGASLLTSPINSPAAVAAGFTPPFPGFQQLWGSRATVAQALRPFPQYTTIDTAAGQGDHSGHSTYHSGIIKLEKRYTNGLTFQTSYVFSKLLTDSDSYWPGTACPGVGGYLGLTPNAGCTQAANFYNRSLEKSIGEYDITHNFKLGLVYDLPFGKGHKMLNHGIGAAILGGWHVSSINYYASGTPVTVNTTVSQPIFGGRQVAYVNSYNGWQPNFNGSFDPSVNNFFVPYGTGPFPTQGPGTNLSGIGNVTRFNPKLRYFPNLNENMSVAKSIPIKEQIRLDFRAEAFNIFNRVRFGTGSLTLQDPNFGHLTSNGDLLNTPRQLQLALKLYF